MDVEPVREWLDHVAMDLDAAWSCARGRRASPSRAAYLVQQAAEKLVKAALVASEIDPPRTHDIEGLSKSLPADSVWRERLEALRRFTPFAFAFRYPGEDVPEPEPSRIQIDAWIGEIEKLKTDFGRWLERAPDPGGEGSAP
jgi:HEPN domain-containing protein